MCIIAVKPQGINTPSKDILYNMFKNNPDGAGIAYNLNSKLYIIKGLMTFDDLWNACKEIPKDSAAIIHTRIQTCGGVCKELTHPFLLTNDILEQRKTVSVIANGEAVAHNGIFNEFNKKDLHNDTTQFISAYLYPLKKLKDADYKSILDDDIENIISRLCGSSNKLAIINQYGALKRYGQGWIYDEGMYYSNESYTDDYGHRFIPSSLWNLTNYNTKQYTSVRKLQYKIKKLRKSDPAFDEFYLEWHRFMSDQEILEYYESGNY